MKDYCFLRVYEVRYVQGTRKLVVDPLPSCLAVSVQGVPEVAVTSVIDGLKELYATKLRPLEAAHKFHDFVSPELVSLRKPLGVPSARAWPPLVRPRRVPASSRLGVP